ncbi:hypothetical protein BJ944DRAFT_37036 [Cunninghamella echinulata]|nr:hypothetical protein BJ944DRAFT_37036 [Cunninghamella echinulata]
MYVMDNPNGYVCRVHTLNEVLYPNNENMFDTSISALLELIFRGEIIMEDTLNIINHITV